MPPSIVRSSARLLAGLAPCAVCRSRSGGPEGLCPECERRVLPPQAATVADDTSIDLLSLSAFDGAARTLVHAIKFGARPRLAVWAGRRLGTAVAAAGWPVARVVPVPLHPTRRRERGFDQAERIAAGAAEVLRERCWNGLTRRRSTGRQARAGRAARRRNVDGAFEAATLPPVPLLLVDDVWTTGTTARACRDALLAAGAREVRVAVLARAGRNGSSARPVCRADEVQR